MTVEWTTRPELRSPVLVAAFQGWNDAGDAATGAAQWLQRAFDARPFASLDTEQYVDFQAARPSVELVDGVIRTIRWPAFTFSAAPTRDSRDLVLLLGVEPNFHWRAFCDDVLDVARASGCELVVTLGALLGDTPHSRPIRCTGSATDDVLAARVGMARSRYEGPTGIIGVLHDAFRRAGFASASIWAPVPHYVASAPSPKATRALLECFARLLELRLDLTDLDIAAAAWERSVAEVVSGDADVSTYIEGLEERYDRALGSKALDDAGGGGLDDEESDDSDDEDWFDEDELPSGETLARDFERYLREQGDEA